MPGLHTIGRWITDRAKANPDRVAVDDRGVLLSYSELESRAENLAKSLRAAGLGIGDRIATISGNSADQVVLFFACAKAGTVLVPLSWRLSPREIANQVLVADPVLLVVEDEFASLAQAACKSLIDPPPTVMFGLMGIESSIPSPRLDLGRAPVIREVQDEDDLLIVFTSGTTANPKAPILTHSNCFWTNLSLSRIAEIRSEDVVLAVMPQYHAGGWNIQPLLAWWVGATVVLERTFDPGRVLHLIEQRRITTMMGVPANYLFLAEHPEFEKTNLSSLKHAIVGGAPMPEPLLRAWHARGVALSQGYGLTEASPNVLCLADDEAKTKVGSAGKPYPHVEVRLVDSVTGEEIEGPGFGELLVSGPGVFKGYFRDELATEAALRDGWLHTGDLFYRDADGFYTVIDRLKDIFITGGESVAPAEIEAVLISHPGVQDAAVIGIASERWGEVPAAFVVRRKGVPVDEQDLVEFSQTKLAKFKVPKSIFWVKEIPRSSSHKIQRRLLAETFSTMSQGVQQ
jgi:fatty-acyl-CoA synthase